MDPILQMLLSWQFIVFGLAVAAIMFVLRKIIEYLMETYTFSVKESKFWNDLMLPILPVFVGSLGALAFKTYPYPEGISSSGGRFIFGLVAGLLSTLLYRVFRAMLIQKISDPTVPAPVVQGPVVQTTILSENNLDDDTLNAQNQMNK